MNTKRIISLVLVAVLFFAAGFSVSYLLPDKNKSENETLVSDGSASQTPAKEETPTNSAQDSIATYAANPAHEFLVGAAAWQMSAEAHALIMQSFNVATENVEEMTALAGAEEDGYSLVGDRLYKDGKRVAVVCDIDDTLVDGVHYTANIIGKNGEWNNKAFTEFIKSGGCTALPGAVDFVNFCIDNGVAVFYVTNRYDQGYKTSEVGYNGEEGYKKEDGTVIGSSTYDIFGQTIYDITMASMEALGFPTNDRESENYSADAVLIVNDNKLNGSSKQGIRDTIAAGGTLDSGERAHESSAYAASIDLDEHHLAMLLGDDLNDIDGIFSGSEETAVTRIELTIENIDKWGSEWIVFPNAVYGSSVNYAGAYGYSELFEAFDYTVENNPNWALYK